MWHLLTVPVARLTLAGTCVVLLGGSVLAQDPVRLRDAHRRLNEIRRQHAEASAPQPGIYRLRALHSPLCLGRRIGGVRIDFLASVICADPLPVNDSRLMLLPHPAGGLTVRLAGLSSEAGTSRRASCATVARDVVLGSPAIDVRPCDFEVPATRWCSAGRGDQAFVFRRKSPGVFSIHQRRLDLPEVDPGVGDCWDVRGASREVGAETIRFGCNGEAQQSFEALFVGPIDAPDEAQCVTELGWREARDGLRRAAPVVGVDLPGGDYVAVATPDDQGRNCAVRCADETRCRAFTWVAPRGQRNEATCWLKDSIPQPRVGSSNVASGVVRPL
jgi:hypothetical protein